MADPDIPDDDSPLTPGEIDDAPFKAALDALLAAWQPFFEQELQRAKDPERLKKEALAQADDCEAEVAFAEKLFERFSAPEIAIRLLPPEAQALVGPIQQSSWCVRHVRCCLIFGWLLCRRPRTFRLFVYYVYRYWLCVRRVLGRPVSNPPTAEEQHDFRTLAAIAAEAYRPYLTDQLATVDFPAGIPDEVLSGRLDCRDHEGAAATVFERLLTADAAQALLGREALEGTGQIFWACRCWCLCAIRLGCCLAGARSLNDLVRCLAYYRRCLRRCFGKPVCAITAPQGCAEEEINAVVGGLIVPVIGTAGGAGFTHYVLEWSGNGGMTFHATDFHYPPIPPGNAVQGNVPVFGGLLALFNTTMLDPGPYLLRLTVSTVTGATCVHTAPFELSKKDVRILGVDGYATMDTSWIDPAARFVQTIPALCARPGGTFETSFGGCLSVQGGAFVGGCENKRVKRYSLDYKPGFEVDCNTPGWTNFWSVDYATLVQQRFINRRTDFSTLTSVWGADCMPFFPGPPPCGPPPWRQVPDALLYPSCWQSKTGACQLSGLFTLRLVVEATDGSTYCDTQRVWIDNKSPCAVIRIDAVPKCADLFVSQFAQPPDCSIPWNLPISGIAFDEYIDPMLPLTPPNDNFDYYIVVVTKQGGPAVQIPIVGPGGACFHGTSRVGNPGVPCAPCVPNNLPPSAFLGTLALFDLRAIDPLCKSQVSYAVPDGFTIRRQECCVYQFDLWVYDRTITSSGPHWAHDSWPVKICNDLPCPPGAGDDICARRP